MSLPYDKIPDQRSGIFRKMDLSFVGDGFPVPFFTFSYNDKSGGKPRPYRNVSREKRRTSRSSFLHI